MDAGQLDILKSVIHFYLLLQYYFTSMMSKEFNISPALCIDILNLNQTFTWSQLAQVEYNFYVLFHSNFSPNILSLRLI